MHNSSVLLSLQAAQSSRGRSNRLSVKPPRPPAKQSRSQYDDYDNMSSTFSFPTTQARLPSNIDGRQLLSAEYPEASERSPSFQRWVPTRRQHSVVTPNSKQHYAPSRHVPDLTDDRVSLQGDLSVCIGLTVQCSPMGATAVRTCAPSYIGSSRRHVIPRCGAAVVDPAALVSWRNSRPARLVPVHSCDDVPDYQSQWPANQRGVNNFWNSSHDVPNFRRHRQSHPPAGLGQPGPQHQLGRDFRIPRAYGNPSITDWNDQARGQPPFEDFAVGFENDLGEDAEGQTGFLDEEESAFDEITQQIASLTQTVNELRFKHRRPVVGQSDDSAYICSGAVFHGRGTRRQR